MSRVTVAEYNFSIFTDKLAVVFFLPFRLLSLVFFLTCRSALVLFYSFKG